MYQHTLYILNFYAWPKQNIMIVWISQITHMYLLWTFLFFRLNIFYLLKCTKRIRHKLNKHMKSSPIHDQLHYYLIEHTWIWIFLTLIQMYLETEQELRIKKRERERERERERDVGDGVCPLISIVIWILYFIRERMYSNSSTWSNELFLYLRILL